MTVHEFNHQLCRVSTHFHHFPMLSLARLTLHKFTPAIQGRSVDPTGDDSGETERPKKRKEQRRQLLSDEEAALIAVIGELRSTSP
jgi:hypothetical protein